MPHVILTSILFQREEGTHRNYCKIIMTVIMFFLFLPEKYLNSLNTKDLQDLDFFLLANSCTYSCLSNINIRSLSANSSMLSWFMHNFRLVGVGPMFFDLLTSNISKEKKVRVEKR